MSQPRPVTLLLDQPPLLPSLAAPQFLRVFGDNYVSYALGILSKSVFCVFFCVQLFKNI